MNCDTFNWNVKDNRPGFVWISINNNVVIELPVVKGNVNIPVGNGYSVVEVVE